MRRRWATGILVLLAGLAVLAPAAAQRRVPRPEFDSNYQAPATSEPPARADWREYADAALLAGMLGLTWHFSRRRRSRRALFALTAAAVVYFGFVRRGCVCAVGGLQAVTAAAGDPALALPLPVIVFFFLPLLAALFFGRLFCGAACPLGAIQDLFLLKPIRVPFGTARVLGLLPHVYLGLAVLLAANGAAAIICRFDPFAPVFRLGGDFPMLLLAGGILLTATVVARPYCRFLCPYGVLLGWASRLAGDRATITPDQCVDCRLCEDACPVGAIRAPVPNRLPEPRRVGVRRLALLIGLLPLLAAGGAWTGMHMDTFLSRTHPTVRLAERIDLEDRGAVKDTTVESRAFRGSRIPAESLHREAARLRDRFTVGGALLGAYLGLAVGFTLIGLSLHRSRSHFSTDPSACLSCGRCMDYCPREHLRRRGAVPVEEVNDEAA